jgi:hypothetical protein
MAFVTVSGEKVFVKAADFQPGDKMLSNAKYVGVEEGKFGNGYLFNEAGTLKFLCATSTIHRMNEAGKFVEGAHYNLIYKGLKQPKNPDAKPYHTFELEVDEDTLGDKIPAAKSAPVELSDDLVL